MIPERVRYYGLEMLLADSAARDRSAVHFVGCGKLFTAFGMKRKLNGVIIVGQQPVVVGRLLYHSVLNPMGIQSRAERANSAEPRRRKTCSEAYRIGQRRMGIGVTEL